MPRGVFRTVLHVKTIEMTGTLKYGQEGIVGGYGFLPLLSPYCRGAVTLAGRLPKGYDHPAATATLLQR